MNRRIFILLSILLISLFALSASAQGITFTPVASGILPWDAAPSPDGATIYYTAMRPDGLPAVLSVPATGGNSTVVAQGAPFALPLALDVSSDGQTLYVADPLTAGVAGNALFAVPTNMAAVTMVAGTQGTEPQGVTVVSENGSDQLYFSGIDLSAGKPTVYKIEAGGAEAPTVVAEGAPLIAPSGIAVAKDGTVYVLDRLASANGMGAVLRIAGGTVDKIATDVRIGGQAAGLALTQDESLLFVSSLDKTAGTAQVLAINLGTMESSIVNDVIKANLAAGGLHRAHNADIFAWADSSAGPPPRPPFVIKLTGQVYSIVWGD